MRGVGVAAEVLFSSRCGFSVIDNYLLVLPSLRVSLTSPGDCLGMAMILSVNLDCMY